MENYSGGNTPTDVLSPDVWRGRSAFAACNFGSSPRWWSWSIPPFAFDKVDPVHAGIKHEHKTATKDRRPCIAAASDLVTIHPSIHPSNQ